MTATDTAAARKSRGAFFTPHAVCAFVADWAVRESDDAVLEPSCGDAGFLVAVGQRLVRLGASMPHIVGYEIHQPSARHATERLQRTGVTGTVVVGDFFDELPTGQFDAVVGNPPYVRYQDFSGVTRTRSRAAALRGGVSLTGLASSWAAFTVHAAMFLKHGGRLGLVLPAELLSVNYASGVRRFLMDRFSRVQLVLFTERVFPGVQEEVVLLLAEGFGQGPADHCELRQVHNVDALTGNSVTRQWRPDPVDGKWTASLLEPHAAEVLQALRGQQHFTTLAGWGTTTLGMVTGNNRYFALTSSRAAELGMHRADLLPLSPPGSRHLRGLAFTATAHQHLAQVGTPAWLFRPQQPLSQAASAYITAGEAAGVHGAYKCRVRSPWWRVPLVRPADLLLTYMNADTPRLCANRAKVHHLNSVHGLSLRPGLVGVGKDLLPVASVNSLTMLAAETVGRAYGGGMLKIEPREAAALPVPSPELLQQHRAQLMALRPQVAAKLRGADGVQEAARLVDRVLLTEAMGMSRRDLTEIRAALKMLRERRQARGVEPRGKD